MLGLFKLKTHMSEVVRNTGLKMGDTMSKVNGEVNLEPQEWKKL